MLLFKASGEIWGIFFFNHFNVDDFPAICFLNYFLAAGMERILAVLIGPNVDGSTAYHRASRRCTVTRNLLSERQQHCPAPINDYRTQKQATLALTFKIMTEHSSEVQGLSSSVCFLTLLQGEFLHWSCRKVEYFFIFVAYPLINHCLLFTIKLDLEEGTFITYKVEW